MAALLVCLVIDAQIDLLYGLVNNQLPIDINDPTKVTITPIDPNAQPTPQPTLRAAYQGPIKCSESVTNILEPGTTGHSYDFTAVTSSTRTTSFTFDTCLNSNYMNGGNAILYSM